MTGKCFEYVRSFSGIVGPGADAAPPVGVVVLLAFWIERPHDRARHRLGARPAVPW